MSQPSIEALRQAFLDHESRIRFGPERPNDRERIGISEEQMEGFQQFIINVAQNNIEPPMGHLLI
ncbi:MAG: hypothetical protein LWW98_10850 [Deltaproteobacteria bacterium]|nr:hypothetical protein [Deltaproteobacteria bacterium]